MKKHKWIIAVAVLTFGTSLALAGEGGKHGRKADMGRLAQKLNLTEAQQTQLAEIRKNFRTANEPFFTEHRETMKQYREARHSGDSARADALKGTLEAQRAQLRQLRQSQEQQIASILTAEQKAQWEAMKAERGGRGMRGQRDRNR